MSNRKRSGSTKRGSKRGERYKSGGSKWRHPVVRSYVRKTHWSPKKSR